MTATFICLGLAILVGIVCIGGEIVLAQIGRRYRRRPAAPTLTHALSSAGDRR